MRLVCAYVRVVAGYRAVAADYGDAAAASALRAAYASRVVGSLVVRYFAILNFGGFVRKRGTVSGVDVNSAAGSAKLVVVDAKRLVVRNVCVCKSRFSLNVGAAAKAVVFRGVV